jgi:hypothetical protein
MGRWREALSGHREFGAVGDSITDDVERLARIVDRGENAAHARHQLLAAAVQSDDRRKRRHGPNGAAVGAADGRGRGRSNTASFLHSGCSRATLLTCAL